MQKNGIPVVRTRSGGPVDCKHSSSVNVGDSDVGRGSKNKPRATCNDTAVRCRDHGEADVGEDKSLAAALDDFRLLHESGMLMTWPTG